MNQGLAFLLSLLPCVALQMSAADIKSEIRDLYITGAKQVSWWRRLPRPR